jgi:hypothetical protein
MDPQSITPLLMAAVVIWVMYRRVRRSFGPQLVQPGRLMFRAGGLFLLGALLLIFAPRELSLYGSFVCGLMGGLVLGYLGLRHTRFETTDKGHFYTPHTYIGLFVTSLLVVRLAMRYVTVYSSPQTYNASPNPWAAYQRNPLTLAIFGLVVGYYVLYNIGLLRKSQAQVPTTTGAPAS